MGKTKLKKFSLFCEILGSDANSQKNFRPSLRFFIREKIDYAIGFWSKSEKIRIRGDEKVHSEISNSHSRF